MIYDVSRRPAGVVLSPAARLSLTETPVLCTPRCQCVTWPCQPIRRPL